MRKDLIFSCIVPVFNESSRIIPIINTLLLCRDLFEIIIINDGSTDDTSLVLSELKHPKLRIIHHKKNTGKTKAIFTGITASRGNYIVTIDGDLLNLETKHIQSLLDPIRLGNADITISLRENSLWIYKLFLNDFVTGERVVPRTLTDDTKYYTVGPGYGLEVKMNKKIIQ
jgi:glycosyltransferase involved in cell wall biosynthesis